MDDAEEVAVMRKWGLPGPSPWPFGTAGTRIQAADSGREGPCRLAGTGLGAGSSPWPHGISWHVAGP